MISSFDTTISSDSECSFDVKLRNFKSTVSKKLKYDYTAKVKYEQRIGVALTLLDCDDNIHIIPDN